MNQRISILGCGWFGLPLAIDLVRQGYEVHGSTTSHTKLKNLEEEGVKPYLIDISKPEVDLHHFLERDVLIIAITSKSIEDYQRLIREIESSAIQKILFISSTSVYPFTNGVVTEETPTLDTPLAAIEQLFLSNPAFATTILRFGGLFGYDRKPGNFVKPERPIEYPEGYVNLIHRDDCVAIIEQVIQKNVWNEVLNACTDDHPKRRDFYLQETQKVGKKGIVFNEASTNDYKIVDSQKLKAILNYTFIHADLMND